VKFLGLAIEEEVAPRSEVAQQRGAESLALFLKVPDARIVRGVQEVLGVSPGFKFFAELAAQGGKVAAVRFDD
jgi:hypothetical protein